jgi:hypothetical protein
MAVEISGLTLLDLSLLGLSGDAVPAVWMIVSNINKIT